MDSRPEQSGAHAVFDDDGTFLVQIDERDVRVNGSLLVTAQSSFQARELAELIAHVAKLPPHERGPAIERSLGETFDVEAIDRCVTEYQNRSAVSRLCGNVLFVYIFLLVPVIVANVGLAATWIPLLTLLVLGHVIALLVFVRTHKLLYGDATQQRRKQVLLMTLNPLAVIRAHDALSRDRLASFHPLAVARVLLGPTEFETAARGFVLDTRFPLQPLHAGVTDVADDIDDTYHQMYTRVLEQFLVEQEIDVALLTAPEPPDQEDVRTYCPRCRCQFLVTDGVCESCGGLPLQSYEIEASAT